MATSSSDKEFKERLIKIVKKEVKQIMEEAVTRKFVHQDSSSVTSLCASVEGCLSHGLRRRALGLFRSSSTTALMHKVAKGYPPAAVISKLIVEAETNDGVKRSSSSGDSITRMVSYGTGVKPTLQKRNSGSWLTRSSNTPKYLWIRLALFERILAGIIEHLVENHMKYYEKDALVADPEYGSVLSHLLVGPCALEYTKMKTRDHYWTDPPADELVQRHRISSGASTGATSPANRRPGLNYRKVLPGSSSSEGDSVGSVNSRNISSNSTAKDYVESLHQNSKVVLLYGKNNVLVLSGDLVEPIPGYLSLHHGNEFLTLKWTPNQLMNGGMDCDGIDKSAFWNDALHVNLYDIVYVHCHQKGIDAGGNMVLVGQDGVQHPAIHFPAGGHLLAFLTCLETGLQPKGRLDPPLWTQTGKGKVFPKIKRRVPLGNSTAVENNGNEEDTNDEPSDYVFRIINNNMINNIVQDHNDGVPDMLDDTGTFCGTPNTPNAQLQGVLSPRSPRWWTTRHSRPFFSSDSTGSSSSSSSKSLSTSLSIAEHTSSTSFVNVFNESPLGVVPTSFTGSAPKIHDIVQRGESLHVLCETMKRQIISRAFYGWLAHCRHLRTVRTHLSGLINNSIVSRKLPFDASSGVNDETWENLVVHGVLHDSFELFRLTYFGGVAHHLRKQVWPYLLGHYPFESTTDEREAQDRAMQSTYETTMSEWLAVEAIIRQRDKENTAASIAKLSFRSQSGEQIGDSQLKGHNQSVSNEVFDDEDSFDDSLHVDEKMEESKDECVCGNSPESQKTTLTTNGARGAKESFTSNVALVKVVTTYPSSGSEEAGEQISCQMSKNDQKISPKIPNTEIDREEMCVVDPPHNKDVTQNPPNLGIEDALDRCSVGSRSPCVSPVSSHGGIYTTELLEKYGLNLHRIDKDVQRCDRNYSYFTPTNLDKLRNIMCTYVWCHLDMGYMQGMCDLVAPLLVVIDDEALTYSCFCELMKRMAANFPQGEAMDSHFSNMRSLIQILDSEIFDLMHQNGDYTHFYFCYRWFLLDFKRELLYEDVFVVWETIWAARYIASSHFVLFVALALVKYYREIILANAMDFTDIIKFFNEMAERHDPKIILQMARDLVYQLQMLMEDK